MNKKFYLVRRADRSGGKCANVGQVVYEVPDLYGLAADDTRITKMEHRIFSASKAGDYPHFTIPMEDVVEQVLQ